ncbi:MAG: tRNA (adenosine(37)-N6)-threonylcarbamoyltransferase complex transferase subunit TsaD [Candidatus Doudnabacteria bacterium]|nr:tRNA (adenosine(37)-N6)-threonylcarbamoyltransferase complex transferase subunit TsaD [Candidatus Doudnabacteria bacterium]
MKTTILAIESSCDETAAAVIQAGKIKSSIIASQAKLHAQYGGVVPEVAARTHINAIIPTIDLALRTAKTKLSELDYIAVTQGPGLMTSLMVGVDTAKALGSVLNIPVVPINHLEAHIYANFIDDTVKFPAIILIVSGGHTLLVEIKNHGKYRILGETVDDAAGEAFDKTAKMMNLGYPGGPMISKLAKNGNPKAFDFPRPMINSGNFQFSFSGLKTAVLYKIQDLKSLNPQQKADLSASLQRAIVDTLIGKLQKSIEQYNPKTIMLGGGVAANGLLREEFTKLGKKNKIKSIIPDFQYCTDNAAMIGLAAYYRIKNRMINTKNFTVDPNLKLK